MDVLYVDTDKAEILQSVYDRVRETYPSLDRECIVLPKNTFFLQHVSQDMLIDIRKRINEILKDNNSVSNVALYEIKEYITHLRNAYDEGAGCSLSESSCGVSICNDILKKIEEKTPKEKIGHWVKKADFSGIYYTCSECRKELPRINLSEIKKSNETEDSFSSRYPEKFSIIETAYCPHCGARME